MYVASWCSAKLICLNIYKAAREVVDDELDPEFSIIPAGFCEILLPWLQNYLDNKCNNEMYVEEDCNCLTFVRNAKEFFCSDK